MNDSRPPLPDGPFQALDGDEFQFACHPGVTCFNQCCADLNLVLTPYDIIRLKNRLGLTSEAFVENHTVSEEETSGRFPKIKLKMTDRPGRPCPFVTPKGCSLYADRPGACRTYPLGRGSAPGGREMFFLVTEDHCLGFREPRSWTVEEWLKDQGLEPYNRFNDLWMEILTEKASLGPEEHHVKKIQMFNMVSYNIDRFRDFVFNSRFLSLFDFGPNLIESIRGSDEALLELGFRWLRFALYGHAAPPFQSRQA